VTTRRLASASIGLVAVFSFAIAGCSGTTGSPTVADSGTTGSPTASPSGTTGEAAAALAAAAGELSKSSFKMTTTWGPSASVVATMNPPNKVGETTLRTTIQNTTVTIDSRLFDSDVYLKLNGALPALEGKWLHVDVQRLSKDSQLGFTPGEFDPASSERLLREAADVKRIGDHGFAGTVDLTKATNLPLFADGKASVNLDAAKAVPFEATTDEQNRLVSLKITVPEIAGQQALAVDTRYSDFGTPVSVQRPAAGEVTEAPDVFYQTIGGR
jgi:hypothetical protein